MKKLYFLKLGGSVLTNEDKPGHAKNETIKRLLSEVRKARQHKEFDIVIGHGAGSFAHLPAKKYKVNEGLKYGFSRKGAIITQSSAHELNNIVVKNGINAGVNLFPFTPSSFGIWNDRGTADGVVSHLNLALNNGFIPLVYGDVVMDAKKGVSIASTEMVLSFLAQHMKPHKIILATDVDGLFTANPKVDRNAKLIRLINGKTIDSALQFAGNSLKVDVTGGMHSKVRSLYNMVKATGATGYIVNANVKGRLYSVLVGNSDICTVVKR